MVLWFSENFGAQNESKVESARRKTVGMKVQFEIRTGEISNIRSGSRSQELTETSHRPCSSIVVFWYCISMRSTNHHYCPTTITSEPIKYRKVQRQAVIGNSYMLVLFKTILRVERTL